MIIVLADAADPEAAGLVHRWASSDALLMTPSDLSHAGWVVEFPTAGPRFVAAGEQHGTADLDGVLVRLAVVTPEHLSGFQPADRAYAAAEMTAFLAYWLSALDCPVVNRPSPSFLPGPAWSTDRWRTVAARIGLALHDPPPAAGDRPASRDGARTVIVVGDRAVGGGPADQVAAVALARHSGVELLGVLVAGPDAGIVSATPVPPLTAEAADLLLDRLAAAA